jgi:hypothetical protein
VAGGAVVLAVAIEETAEKEAAEGKASGGEAARWLLRLNRRGKDRSGAAMGDNDGRFVASGWWRGACPVWETVVQRLSWLCWGEDAAVERRRRGSGGVEIVRGLSCGRPVQERKKNRSGGGREGKRKGFGKRWGTWKGGLRLRGEDWGKAGGRAWPGGKEAWAAGLGEKNPGRGGGRLFG